MDLTGSISQCTRLFDQKTLASEFNSAPFQELVDRRPWPNMDNHWSLVLSHQEEN